MYYRKLCSVASSALARCALPTHYSRRIATRIWGWLSLTIVNQVRPSVAAGETSGRAASTRRQENIKSSLICVRKSKYSLLLLRWWQVSKDHAWGHSGGDPAPALHLSPAEEEEGAGKERVLKVGSRSRGIQGSGASAVGVVPHKEIIVTDQEQKWK